MAGCLKQSSSSSTLAKTLFSSQSAPLGLRSSFAKCFFCKVTSTGDTVDNSSAGAKKKTGGDKGEHTEEQDSGYGNKQRKPGEAAHSAHAEWEKSGSSSAHEESLADTGFDMSKRTKPAGDE